MSRGSLSLKCADYSNASFFVESSLRESAQTAASCYFFWKIKNDHTAITAIRKKMNIRIIMLFIGFYDYTKLTKVLSWRELTQTGSLAAWPSRSGRSSTLRRPSSLQPLGKTQKTTTAIWKPIYPFWRTFSNLGFQISTSLALRCHWSLLFWLEFFEFFESEFLALLSNKLSPQRRVCSKARRLRRNLFVPRMFAMFGMVRVSWFGRGVLTTPHRASTFSVLPFGPGRLAFPSQFWAHSKSMQVIWSSLIRVNKSLRWWLWWLQISRPNFRLEILVNCCGNNPHQHASTNR